MQPRDNHTQKFQSTHPHGCELLEGTGLPRTDVVSIHAPARVRTHRLCRSPDTFRRFNPRTRTGANEVGAGFDLAWFGVSIHAPARVRTPERNEETSRHEVSIHAPARVRTSHGQKQGGKM